MKCSYSQMPRRELSGYQLSQRTQMITRIKKLLEKRVRLLGELKKPGISSTLEHHTKVGIAAAEFELDTLKKDEPMAFAEASAEMSAEAATVKDGQRALVVAAA